MRILNYQRMSTEDGPGLRTTLFVKGCPLRCAWCHNPESIEGASSVEWIKIRCISCNSCISVCTRGAITAEADEIRINAEKCALCFSCVEACPTGALERRGQEVSVEAVFEELIKDKAYFGAQGGVTLSGGEIMLQTKEAALLLKMLKEAGVSTAVDTSGFCKREDLEKVLPYTDLILYDLKLAFAVDTHDAAATAVKVPHNVSEAFLGDLNLDVHYRFHQDRHRIRHGLLEG